MSPLLAPINAPRQPEPLTTCYQLAESVRSDDVFCVHLGDGLSVVADFG
jgi:hypothetical protein